MVYNYLVEKKNYLIEKKNICHQWELNPHPSVTKREHLTTRPPRRIVKSSIFLNTVFKLKCKFKCKLKWLSSKTKKTEFFF